jgi:putative ABC transport system permease protein
VNLASLSASYLRARPLNTALSIVLLALGVGTIVMLILVVSQLEERMGRDARGIDLVVGAKGSPMQLILSGIFHVDAPTGNIPLSAVEMLAGNRMVKQVMPLALGDSWKGYRIVGAGHEYVEHYGARPAAGRLWQQPMEAVLGAEVAMRTGVRVGEQFVGAHGIAGEGGEEHGETPYTIVGVLERSNSVLDRLVLTSVESVWLVHEEHHEPADEFERRALEEDREVTVLLVQYASPLAAASLPRSINAQTELQAASPAYETARLFRIIGVGVEALRAFAVVMILAAALSVFIALYTALEERRYDLAVMRTLGASPARLFGLLVAEGVLLAALGALLGVALGHGLAWAFGAWLQAEQHYAITGLVFRPEELWIVAIALAVGALAALLPAWRAYRTDVARILAQT